ncbi:hypothetical protein A6A05_05825 [Magnetospirillum moscoviense]|uniref:DUF4435 domain-containing protein n=2 Tax=Magnetospirillum moscoviense TaxID=1437059 RepID=A0A178N192_9PROT|nr:hypothetical protein A6A05_05825 [Magnetospirillum moscoviense]
MDQVLLVEGDDDFHVLAALCRHQGIPESFEIIKKGGYEALRDGLSNEIKSPGRRTLGIVIDADQDIAARWQSLAGASAKAGVTLPATPDPAGTIVETPGSPRVGVWLMPDNRTTGMLEDFVAFLVPEGDALFSRATDTITAIPADLRRFSEIHATKATIHTWLAWQDEPGRPMGQAVTKRILDPDCSQAAAFALWLRRLFG